MARTTGLVPQKNKSVQALINIPGSLDTDGKQQIFLAVKGI